MKRQANVAFWLMLCVGGCATAPVQHAKTIEFYRMEMGLVSCGLKGSLGARMADCRIQNPNYSTARIQGSPYQWGLVQLDIISENELWYDHSAGKVWSNAFRYKSVNCADMPPLDAGGRELRFHTALHEEYREAYRHQMPMRIGLTESRLFVPADVAERGMVVDEADHTLKNVQWEKPLWVRCVAD